MKLKRSTALVLSLLFMVLPIQTSFAASPEEESNLSTARSISEETLVEKDLNLLDLSMPYSETTQYTDEQGKLCTLTLNFTPAPQNRGSSTNNASVGTWTSSFTAGIINMSYTFDLSKSGSQWVISNARNHKYSGAFMTFSNASLYISRSTSTASFPAEINASVFVSVFDNQWFVISQSTATMYTTVSSSGTMTLYY